MSGEANASIESEHYSVAVGSGLVVDVALPPGDDGSAIGEWFDRHSAPFRRWLALAQPELDTLFADLVAEGEPIVPRAQPYETLFGVFLEDKEKQFHSRHRGGPLAVRLESHRLLSEGRSLRLFFLVSTQVSRARMESILARVAEVLSRHAVTAFEPQPSEEPEDAPLEGVSPAPRPRPWWRRWF